MPLVKQTGVVGGARRNLNLLCDVFLLGTLLMGVLLIAPGCCAKIETQIKLLNDDYTVPTRTGNNEAASSSSSSSSDSQQPTVPHYNLYKSDLKRISYETIHRILRDENEPMIYRTNDLRYFTKRSSTTEEHEITKRSVIECRPPPPGIRLNLTSSNLQTFSRTDVNSTDSPVDITSIILRHNSLSEFPLAAWPNVTALDLSENNFTHFELPPGSSQLRVLNLNQNRIVNFITQAAEEDTQHSNSLHELHLKDNSMCSLGQLNLGLLNELEILDLSCNQLENLETAFFPTRMRNLKYLNLARNRLQCIYRETFYNLLSMNTLILSYNEISEIDYETFLALPNLQYLDLSHNQLRGDSIRALQGIPDLVGLSIAYNWQLGDSMQEFVASWSLKELDASGTGLCKIPAALAQSVRTLKLADNWLTTINCGDLDSYPLLQYLDLSQSHIDEIEEDALGRLEILETLFLDHNNLKRIPISLPTSLEHLFLHDNQIMDIQPQSFQGLNNLKTLDLSSNKLLYMPDLPLPKLLTLNLQSSGINGLHQAIVKTSPHLRDLYLEDNPIKCADLLGIAEWASPCRNDRRITKRINIKSHYVQMHNYFERFQCGGNAITCASCMGNLSQMEVPTGNTAKPNCVDVNGLGKVAKTSPEGAISNEEPIDITTETTLTRKTYAPDAATAESTSTDANQDGNKGTSNAPRSSPTTAVAQPEVSTQRTTTTTTITTTTRTITTTTASSRIQTNSTDKISASPQQKQLADEIPSPAPSIRSPSEIKSDNNYVETSGGNSRHPTPPAVRSLLSQEYTGKSQKGLKAQSDNATKIGHSTNGEISVATAAAKSNFPAKAEFVKATTMTVGQIHTAKGSNGLPREQQHNKIQEVLHTKDRHLIGTPLLMHKGHVVLVSPSVAAITATTSKENLLHLAPLRNDKGSHGSSTTITTSKGHKFETVLGTFPQQQQHNQNHYQQPQQGANQNAIIKGAKKKMANGPLGQENHYQDIQQTQQQQQHKVHPLPAPKRIAKQKQHQTSQNGVATDKKDNASQQKFKDTTPMGAIRKDSNLPNNNKDKFDVNEATEQDKQFASNLGATQQHHSSHSLNTPLDGKIPSRDKDDIFRGIEEVAAIGGSTTTTTTTPPHHSRVNTPLLRSENDLQNNSQGQTSTSTAPSSIKPETGPKTEPQQAHTVKSERWLDIRQASRHPGLMVVVGVTLASVFIVGLVQVYRCRQKPLNLIGHRHYGYQHEHHQHQYQEHDYQQHDYHHHFHHHHQHHRRHHPAAEPQPDNIHCDDANSQNQCSKYGCNDDRMQPTVSAHNSPHHLLRIHEKPPSSTVPLPIAPISNCEVPSEKGLSGYTTNSSSATSNYRLFQLNGRRIKHNHHPLSLSSLATTPPPPPPPKPTNDENDFYTEMNHGPQSVLASDFFPMELLSAPSRIPSSSMAVPSTSTITSTSTIRALSLVGADNEPKQQQTHRIDDEFQDTTGRQRSKFEIW